MKVTLQFDSYSEFLDFVSSRRAGSTNKTHISWAGLSLATQAALQSEGIAYIEDAQGMGTNALLKIPKMSRQAALEVIKWKPPEVPA